MVTFPNFFINFFAYLLDKSINCFHKKTQNDSVYYNII